jgi:hypothetical protein
MGGKGSGGHNAISVVEHLRAGTYRADRHGTRLEPPASAPVAPEDRQRILAGLGADGRRLAAGLLDAYDGWHAASLVTLRLAGACADRLAGALDDAERRREARLFMALIKTLELEK